jgi:hypothetical protein
MGIRCADHVTPLYPQKLALTSPTGGGRSVGIVRSRTNTMEFSLVQHPYVSYKETESLSEAVLISFGPTNGFPKMLYRWRASVSQQQVICCTVSVSILQSLQVGSPLNRPTVHRCHLTAACPVRIATAIFSWCLPNLSRSSALFLHGLPIKSLPCLQKYLWNYCKGVAQKKRTPTP